MDYEPDEIYRQENPLAGKCLVCHKHFIGLRAHAKTCGPRCRKILSRYNQKKGKSDQQKQTTEPKTK